MSGSQSVFVCSNCGEEYLKWQGKCENCGSWNTLKEFQTVKQKNSRQKSANFSEPVKISQVKTNNFQRISTTISEFDRVLGGGPQGGGLVPGSISLLGGDPGIGKSTLLLEVAAKLDEVLYVSGEESVEQIKMRFDRLKLQSSRLKIYAEVDLDAIIQTVKKENPKVVIIDSIQTIYSADFPSTPGSLVQVRECSLRLQQLAKSSSIPIILVGHVTKEGSVAGPRTLEHLVDVVLYLEGERFHHHRILRGEKNRFGATDEIGIFAMTERGLKEVANPSELFLEERLCVPGNVVTATIEGTRALLVEVQALTTPANFGFPQRRASGFDLNRLQLVAAVLQKRGNINLANQDIFINVVGGIKVKEPAVDLAVALAIASSVKGTAMDQKICVFGEVGLAGELRKVSLAERRKSEANRLGFTRFIESKTLSLAINNYLKS